MLATAFGTLAQTRKDLGTVAEAVIAAVKAVLAVVVVFITIALVEPKKEKTGNREKD